jgi:sugar lactone lactonase YvrE
MGGPFGAAVQRRAAWFLVTVLCAAAMCAVSAASWTVRTLRSVAALPPHIAGTFTEPAGFAELEHGGYLVFDRRGHTVFGVDAARTTATRLVSVGHESGRIIQPVAFAAARDGTFIVSDAPVGRERVQRFAPDGSRLGGFVLPGRVQPRVQFGGFVLNGVGSAQYDGEAIYVNEPERGALITRYSVGGTPVQTVGTLRQTDHEQEPDLHLAFNTGLPAIDPGGGLYFIFQTGEPRIRKYDANGRLLFERVIQGPELDPLIASQPKVWPTRKAGNSREIPIVSPLVRTAAVDRHGNLWVALTVPFTYVYDAAGEKIYTVTFTAAGQLSPTSLYFARDGRLLVTPGCYIFAPEQTGDPVGAVLRFRPTGNPGRSTLRRSASHDDPAPNPSSVTIGGNPRPVMIQSDVR